MKAARLPLFLIVTPVLVLAVSGFSRPDSPQAAIAASAAANGSSAAQVPSTRGEGISVRHLSVDESMGGHTLARHVGKTDAELADRLRREPSDLERINVHRSRHSGARRRSCPGVCRRPARRVAEPKRSSAQSGSPFRRSIEAAPGPIIVSRAVGVSALRPRPRRPSMGRALRSVLRPNVLP